MAQKLSKIGWPRKSLRWTVRVPSRVSRAKSGARSPIRGALGRGGVREVRWAGVPVGARAPEWGADAHPPVLITTIPATISVRSMRMTIRERILSTFALISNLRDDVCPKLLACSLTDHPRPLALPVCNSYLAELYCGRTLPVKGVIAKHQ